MKLVPGITWPLDRMNEWIVDGGCWGRGFEQTDRKGRARYGVAGKGVD